MATAPHNPHTPLHWLLPYAGTHDEAAQPLLGPQGTLELPHLQRLLARMQPLPEQVPDAGAAHQGGNSHPGTRQDPAYTWSPPHEVALARALGWTLPGGAPLPDGQIPWAAHEAGRTGVPCAWFIPCQYRVGMEEVSLVPPQDLQLDEAASRRLFDALRPLAEEDGLRMTWLHPHRWLAEGAPLAGLASASLDRVAHRRIEAWLPDPRQHAALVRLQSEAQMLFYTHPLHDERSAAGLPAINGFWMAGSGVWHGEVDTDAATRPAVEQVDKLRTPALHGHWAAWADAWRELDATRVRGWLEQLERLEQAGQAGSGTLFDSPVAPVQLTLCGERSSRRWVWRPGQPDSPPASLWQRLQRRAGLWLGTSRPGGDWSAPALRECLRSL